MSSKCKIQISLFLNLFLIMLKELLKKHKYLNLNILLLAIFLIKNFEFFLAQGKIYKRFKPKSIEELYIIVR